MKQKLKDSFLYAFRRSMPIMIGYFALGSANGILMAQKGYSVGLTGIASLFIYAGTQQMLLSGWLAAGRRFLRLRSHRCCSTAGICSSASRFWKSSRNTGRGSIF